MNNNIEYRSEAMIKYFTTHRIKWEHLYQSEKFIFEKVEGFNDGIGDMLDVGCAAGGLADALHERFSFKSYLGIDIHKGLIDAAIKKGGPKRRFVTGDILEKKDILESHFDWVISLSCVDWNIETLTMIKVCWEKVKPGGFLIMQVRLTNLPGINNIQKSYQWTDYFGQMNKLEKANYVIFNERDYLSLLSELRPCASNVYGYGYWGKVSPTAITQYEELVFSVFAIQKVKAAETNKIITPKIELNLPLNLFLAPKY